ncbi:excalibur calcium-binding domain-containing protein [Rhodococcus sp. SJ-3]|uniref:excalibur calcium-binding domain-containing protein n=1 Tax=Rhodococcus sp. SJ-3 TaxID=3454628 RepID=UPI003F796A28
MAESITPSEAKAIAERHLKSLGFVLTPGSGPGRMLIRAPGVVAKVTLRAAPVVDIDPAGRVDLRNDVGLRASGSTVPVQPPAFEKSADTKSEWSSDPVGKAMEIWKSPQAVETRKLLRSAGRSLRSRFSSTGTGAADVVAERKLPSTPASRRANRGLVLAGVAMAAVVGGGVVVSALGSDHDPGVAPVTVVSTTPAHTVSRATNENPTTREIVQPPSQTSSSIVPTTTEYTPPPPVYTPPPETTYEPPPPVYTTEYTPPPAPRERPSAYYKNCDAARAAGAAPLNRESPGYRPELDRDDDGIACEWS